MKRDIRCGNCNITSEYEITYENKTFVRINCNACGIVNKVKISDFKKSKLKELYDKRTDFTDINLKPLSTNSDGHLINYGWGPYSGDDEDLSDVYEMNDGFGMVYEDKYESDLYEENDEDEW